MGGIPGCAFAMASFSGSLINSLLAMPFPFLALWHSVPECWVCCGDWVVGWLGGWVCWVCRVFGWLAFGTGEGLLWYRICVPCSKRLPGVRDAFSKALGAQNRLLRYGRDIRCQKPPPTVRNESTGCGGLQEMPLLAGGLLQPLRRYYQPFLYICV